MSKLIRANKAGDYISKYEWKTIEKKSVELGCKSFQQVLIEARIWPLTLKVKTPKFNH